MTVDYSAHINTPDYSGLVNSYQPPSQSFLNPVAQGALQFAQKRQAYLLQKAQQQKIVDYLNSMAQANAPQQQTMNVAGHANAPIASYNPESDVTTPTMTPGNPQMRQLYAGLAQAPENIRDKALPKIFEQDAKSMFQSGAGAKKPMGATSLQNADPKQVQLAEAVLAGNVRPFDLSQRSQDPFNRGVIVALANELAQQRGIPFQSYGGDVKRGMASSLAYGKLGQNALSLNTAIGHAKSALNAYAAVQNMDVNLLNRPINQIRRLTNDPNITQLDVSLNALRGELATVFKGSSGTDVEIGHWANVLSSDLTPEQAVGAIKQVNDLLDSRIGAIQYQQGDVMNRAPSQRQLISPKSEEIKRTLGDRMPGKNGLTPSEQQELDRLEKKYGKSK